MAEEIRSFLDPDIPADIYAVGGTSKLTPFTPNEWWVRVVPDQYAKAYETLKAVPQYIDLLVEFEPHKLMGPCPRCLAHAVIPKEISTLYLIFSVILLGLPVLFHTTTYICLQCGYHFKKSELKDDRL